MDDYASQVAADERLIGNVKFASDALDQALSADAETADTQVKYAEWIALLATGGFAATLSSADKMGALLGRTHPKIAAAALATVLLSFVLSIFFSAWVLKSFITYRALFRQHRTLVAAQAVALCNHPKLVTSMVEANSILEERSPEDQLFDDIVRFEGGSVIWLQRDQSGPPAIENYEQKQIRLEAERLSNRLKFLSAEMKKVAERRFLYSRRLKAAGNTQLATAAIGYILLMILKLI